MLSLAAVMLAGTTSIAVATGIAVIWNRDPIAMVNSGRTLEEAFPGRFVLGVGVSHKESVDGRGGRYRAPIHKMREYLETMRQASTDAHPPGCQAPLVEGALGPKMTAVAAALADGVHPFLSTPPHTATTRQILGSEPLVAVEQAVVLTKRAEEARSAARANLGRHLTWFNHRRHLTRIGFTKRTSGPVAAIG